VNRDTAEEAVNANGSAQFLRHGFNDPVAGGRDGRYGAGGWSHKFEGETQQRYCQQYKILLYAIFIGIVREKRASCGMDDRRW
jgi:hypothetical protein